MNIKFRENFERGEVWVYVDDSPVFRSGEFLLAMKWAQQAYNLTEAQEQAIRVDYKNDYDNRRDD